MQIYSLIGISHFQKGGCRINVQAMVNGAADGRQCQLIRIFHYKFCHGRTADVAVADKKYFYHILITPYKPCISFQIPNITGFSGI